MRTPLAILPCIAVHKRKLSMVILEHQIIRLVIRAPPASDTLLPVLSPHRESSSRAMEDQTLRRCRAHRLPSSRRRRCPSRNHWEPLVRRIPQCAATPSAHEWSATAPEREAHKVTEHFAGRHEASEEEDHGDRNDAVHEKFHCPPPLPAKCEVPEVIHTTKDLLQEPLQSINERHRDV